MNKDLITIQRLYLLSLYIHKISLLNADVCILNIVILKNGVILVHRKLPITVRVGFLEKLNGFFHSFIQSCLVIGLNGHLYKARSLYCRLTVNLHL